MCKTLRYSTRDREILAEILLDDISGWYDSREGALLPLSFAKFQRSSHCGGSVTTTPVVAGKTHFNFCSASATVNDLLRPAVSPFSVTAYSYTT